jgi:protein arginine kinase
MLQSLQTHAIPTWLSHQGPDCDVVVSTSIAVRRNVADRRFPSRASPHELAMMFDDITDAFGRPGLGDAFNCINFSQLDEREKLFLVEERLVARAPENGQGSRGLVHDRSGRISVTVNGEDHLKMQAMDSGSCARELWTDLDALDDAIGMRIEYAFDNRLGFLTCRPSEAGTGLTVSLLVHLPALAVTGSIGDVLIDAQRQGMSVGGFFGLPLPAAGSMVELSGSAGTRSGESRFCEDMAVAIRTIVDRERKARERLLSDERELLTKKIDFAFSSLLGAPRLTVKEFLDMTSELRLGIECTLFDRCTIVDLNRLTLFVQPAHLQTFLKRDIDESEIARARAGLVHSFFARDSEE